MSILKRIIGFLLIFCIIIPNTYAQDFYEIKNYIVVLDTPAVYSSDRPVVYSRNKEAADNEYRNALIALQQEIKREINGGISFFSTDEGFSYTELLNGFTIKMTEQKAEEVRNMSGVSAVIEDIVVSAAVPAEIGEASEIISSKLNSGNMINADKMHKKGYDGAGKAIAIIDSGLDTEHIYFQNPNSIKYTKQDIEDIIKSKSFIRKFSVDQVYRSAKIPFAFNYAENSTTVNNGSSSAHGTHVTGIAAGSSKETVDGIISGVAPNAQILFFGVFSNNGAHISNIFAAMQDAVKLEADVINLSLGEKWLSENFEASPTSIYWLVRYTIQNAKNAGVSIVYAAGNFSNGSPESTDYIDYSTADNSTFPHAVKAGSVNAEYIRKNNEIIKTHEQLTVSDFSSYGYSDSLDIAVDFAAPGGDIYSAYPSLGAQPHNMFATMSGTSMAAPQISGAILLMNQYVENAFPTFDGAVKENLVRCLLASTAKTIYDENATIASSRVVGSGLVDLESATNTKVFLSAKGSEFSRITLGEISDTFEIKFTAHNLSNAPITFDTVTAEFSTDDYREVNGVYKFNGLKKLNPAISGDTSVTIPAFGYTDVTLSAALDADEIEYLNKGFKNGFFVDGKVTLSGDENVSVGIPFTAFYGNWDSQPIIVNPAKSVVTRADGANFYIDTPAIEENGIYVLYKSKKDVPFTTHFFMNPDRNCDVYFSQNPQFANKYHLIAFDGQGNCQIKFALPEKAVSQTLNLSIRDDSIPPDITIMGEAENAGEMYTTLEFSDAQSAVSALILNYDGLAEPLVIPVNESSKLINIKTSHKNATVTACDKAFNSTTIKIGVEMSVNNNVCTIVNQTGKTFSGICVLGVYEGEKLTDLKVLSDNLSLGIMENTRIDVSAYSDKHYKIFCWGSDYSPACEMYENKI